MCKTAYFLGILTISSLLVAGAVALAEDEPASREEAERRVDDALDYLRKLAATPAKTKATDPVGSAAWRDIRGSA